MNRIGKTLAVAAIATVVLTIVLYAPASSWAGGDEIFKSKCAMCHGADGTGNTAMGKKMNIVSLTSPDAQKLTDAQLVQIISGGKNKMPAYKDKLKPEEITQVVATIRALKK